MRAFGSIPFFLAIAALAPAPPFARAAAGSAPGASPTPSATQPENGSLRIVITAIQGQAEAKETADAAWHTIREGQVFGEGCEFRTGPRGAVQFTVGDDQVFRVDRLSLVQVIGANLSSGTIKTTVGLTYGRISKDVDVPILPHDDTIVSPSTTLAVRGTRVSVYDQPPYQPEAVSLTGPAVYANPRGRSVQFGAKGGRTAKLAGNADGPAQYQLQISQIDPLGAFWGRSESEEPLLNYLGSLGGVFDFSQLVRDGESSIGSVIGSVPLQGELFFPMVCGNGPAFTVVDYTVTSPLGETVSRTMPMVPSGGFYNTGDSDNIAGSDGTGFQEIDWSGNPGGQNFPSGTYTLTETLSGTTTQTLAQNPATAVTATQFATVMQSNGQQTSIPPATALLNAASPTASYKLKVPVNAATQFRQITGNPASH